MVVVQVLSPAGSLRSQALIRNQGPQRQLVLGCAMTWAHGKLPVAWCYGRCPGSWKAAGAEVNQEPAEGLVPQ